MEQNDNSHKAPPRILQLIEGFKSETLTEEEDAELNEWVDASEENSSLFEDLTEDMYDDSNVGSMLPRYVARALRAEERVRWLRRILIGAGILAVLVGIFIVVNHIYSFDIFPAPRAVVLELADKSTLDVTYAEQGTVATENGTILKKTNKDELLYQVRKATTNSLLLYNRLSTWKGNQYKVVLPDGSRVTLNAESSLHYPTQFVGGNRQVELDGEAYFEVAPKVDSTGNKIPFIVKLRNDGIIKSLAAHFNVTSYSNELNARVTLFQGNAEMARGNQTLKLQPNQQGLLATSLQLMKEPDVNEVIGWKNGQFVFRDADMKAIERQIDRWYNVRIIGASDITARFNVTAPRNAPLSKLLNLLQATGQVHFRVRGRKVFVLR